MKAIRINNINDLLNAVYATMKKFGGQHLWWRGQAHEEWDLLPQLYQKGFTANESDLSHLFLSKAKVRHSKCPKSDDYYSWLLLMQHNGLPTRLLNWSESILVATYFAVSEKKYMEQAGALWGMDPTLLNQHQINRKGILVHQNDEVKNLFDQAFLSSDGDGKDQRTLAVLTDQLDVKQVVQYSAFTIHGTDCAINRFMGWEKFLVKYEIPITAKSGLLQALDLLGIKKSFLFPDLEHLADDLQRVEFV